MGSTETQEASDLAERHLPLVKSIALKLRAHLPPQLELDDLIAYGTKGLLEAAQRYDPDRGTTFATFAYYRIRGAMFDGLRENGALSRTEFAKARMLERADDYLENAAERERGADPAALARRSTADTLGQLSAHVAALTVVAVTSLDAQAGGEPEDPQSLEPYDRLDGLGLRPHLRAALQGLSERERRLVELCYYQNQSLRAAGKELGISKSWASRLHGRALFKLQRYLSRRDAAIPPPAAGPP